MGSLFSDGVGRQLYDGSRPEESSSCGFQSEQAFTYIDYTPEEKGGTDADQGEISTSLDVSAIMVYIWE